MPGGVEEKEGAGVEVGTVTTAYTIANFQE